MTIKRWMQFVQFVGQYSRIDISEISILIMFISRKTMLDATGVINAQIQMVKKIPKYIFNAITNYYYINQKLMMKIHVQF